MSNYPLTDRELTSRTVNQLCHTAEGFVVAGVVDQDERTPLVVHAVADILVKWYAAIPGYDLHRDYEYIVEDVQVAIQGLLDVQTESKAMDEGRGGAADQRN